MKKQTKKVIIIVLLIIAGLFGFYELGKKFSPGSYSNAEIYTINASEKDLIKAINQFKILNPDYIVPRVTINNGGSFSLEESEGRKDNSHWYLNYFYYKMENNILLTWTRPKGKTETEFAFISINKGLDLGHWKEINKDFEIQENRKIKKEFENRILQPIKALLVK